MNNIKTTDTIGNTDTVDHQTLAPAEREPSLPAAPLDLTMDLGRVSLSRTLVLLHDYFRFGAFSATAELEAYLYETGAAVHAEDLLDQLESLTAMRRREDQGGTAPAPSIDVGKPAVSAGAPEQPNERGTKR
ncbi:MAG: hypothetical protein R2707_16430 [Acidimicrobiales bacterium]